MVAWRTFSQTWHVQRGDAGKAQPRSAPLSNGAVPARRRDFPSMEKANYHSKTVFSLPALGRFPHLRSPNLSESKEALESPSLNWCFRICLAHDLVSLPLSSTSGKQPRIPQADSCFQLMERWTNTTSTEEYFQTVANVVSNTNQTAYAGVMEGRD